jgi:hypothetical protein
MRLTRGFMRSLVLLETPDEVAIRIAYALDSPLDMLRLSIACKRFRLRTITGSRMDSGSGSEQGGMPELWSIVEAAARRWLAARPSAQRDWVPHWEDSVCTLGLMHELRLLMAPTRFSQTHSMVTLSAGGTVATLTGETAPPGTDVNVDEALAASGVPMRAGRHFAIFTLVDVDVNGTLLGVIQPKMVETVSKAIKAGEDERLSDCSCFLDTSDGSRFCGAWEFVTGTYNAGGGWAGQYNAWKSGDCVGMLLDLDQGSLTVYCNNVRLGVMAVGLSGEYCWAASLGAPDMAPAVMCVSIESAPVPAPVLVVGAAVTWSRSLPAVPTGTVGEITEVMSYGTMLCRFPARSMLEPRLEELLPATAEQAAQWSATKVELDAHLTTLVVGAVVVYTGPEFVLVAGNNSLGDLAPGTVGEVTAVRDSGELRVKVPADDIIGLRSHSHDAIHYAALAYTSCELEPVDLTLATVEQVEHWTVTKRTLDGNAAKQLAKAKAAARKQLGTVKAVCLEGQQSTRRTLGYARPPHSRWPPTEDRV